MVWSEQTGASILLPSDRVTGDGQNYMIIGQDVPTQIADDFTAALVFYSGIHDGTEQVVPVDSTVLAGFVFYAIGISHAGNLEFVVYFFSTGSNMSESYKYYRQTVMSIAAPTQVAAQAGVPNGPVLSLGSSTAYGSYNEGAPCTVISDDISTSLGPEPLVNNGTRQVLSNNFAAYGGNYGGVATVYKDSNGVCHLQGLVKNVSGTTLSAGTTICVLTPEYRPSYYIMAVTLMASGANTFGQVIILPSGIVQFQSMSLTTGQWVNLTGISWLPSSLA